MRLRVVLIAVSLLAAAPALANEDPRPNSSPPKVNKDADAINASNPRVFHAGPGKPLQGSIWMAPSAAKPAKKEEGGEHH
ncbi:MAG: hypothetical protein GC202_03040 [Alphaproteobacteria bacterium]|nr:hypothetical protein [Alphaproteobacteria bacterium]